MNSILILTAVAALGIEAGWEPLPDGGHEYTIQIEPQLLDVLRDGKEIFSEVPPQIHVRRYRVTIGTQKLAQIDGEPQAAAEPKRSEHQERDPAENPFTSAPREPIAAETSQSPPIGESPTGGPAPHSSEEAAKQRTNPPGILPQIGRHSKPLENQPAAHLEPESVDTNKPELPPDRGESPRSTEPGRPWLPLLIAMVLLCCSLGGNAYLGWIAWDARRGHRDALARFRTAEAT